MGRLVGIVVAVALVAIGAFIRSSRDGDGSFAGSQAVVICDPALAQSCARLDAEIIVEPAATTYERLSSGADLGATAWVTFDPWPAMVVDAQERARLPVSVHDVEAVATSPVVWAVWNDRAAVLVDRCGAPLDWDCATGESTWAALGGDPRWGPIEYAHADPDTTGSGVALLGTVAQGRLGPTFSGSDVRSREFVAWLRRAVSFVPDYDPPQGTPLAAMLQVGPAGVDAVLTPAAELTEALAASGARAAEVTTVAAAPDATIDVVVASDGAAADLAADLRSDLTGRGWEAGGAVAAGPSPGTLIALWETWQEIAS